MSAVCHDYEREACYTHVIEMQGAWHRTSKRSGTCVACHICQRQACHTYESGMPYI